MKTVIMKDNSQKSKEDFEQIGHIVRNISDKTLVKLEQEGVFVFPENIRETKDLSGEQMILQSVNEFFCTGNVMGFLGVGDERLFITSRFCNGNSDFLFQYLLEKVLDFPNIAQMETDANSEEKVFQMFVFLFPRYLKAAVRKGIFKTYIRKDYNDGNPKGRIEIANHIRKNIPFTGRIAYSQREFSFDNYLMELIRHTIEYIRHKSYGNKLLETVKEEVKLVVEATGGYRACDLCKVMELNKKNVVRHAYYQEYRALQQLCVLILQNQKHSIGTGSNRIFGILVDGVWLWEEYINLLVSDIFYHPMNKAKTGKQYLFAENKGEIYPDFIGKNNENRIIADAKYKPVNNIGNKDYLQILAYMFRFEAKQGFYFYPETQEKKAVKLPLNRGNTYEKNVVAAEDIRVIKYGLKIPDSADDYKEFVCRMKNNEEVFKNGLRKEI